VPGAGPIDRADHALEDWELLVEALSEVLNAKGLRSHHESRRVQESLPPDRYESLRYYERWVVAAEVQLIERGVLTQEEIDARARELAERWDGA
jgi:hypothetical protein